MLFIVLRKSRKVRRQVWDRQITAAASRNNYGLRYTVTRYQLLRAQLMASIEISVFNNLETRRIVFASGHIHQIS